MTCIYNKHPNKSYNKTRESGYLTDFRLLNITRKDDIIYLEFVEGYDKKIGEKQLKEKTLKFEKDVKLEIKNIENIIRHKLFCKPFKIETVNPSKGSTALSKFIAFNLYENDLDEELIKRASRFLTYFQLYDIKID